MAKETHLQLVQVLDQDLIKTLAYLQSLAMNNQIHGIAATVFADEYRHKIIMSGEYLNRPHTARRPIEELEYLAKEQARKLEQFEIVRL